MAGTESKTRRGGNKSKSGPKIIEMPPDLGERLVEHCKKGLSIRSFCAVARISWETLQEFRKTDCRFADLYQQAKYELVLHCENQLNEVIDEKRSPAVTQALKFKMFNLIKWSDKSETKSKQKIEQTTTHKLDTSSLSEEELDSKIKELEEE
jgi:hypothetical protein